jgi:hypothetical protein
MRIEPTNLVLRGLARNTDNKKSSFKNWSGGAQKELRQETEF